MTLETFGQSDEETKPDLQKDKDKVQVYLPYFSGQSVCHQEIFLAEFTNCYLRPGFSCLSAALRRVCCEFPVSSTESLGAVLKIHLAGNMEEKAHSAGSGSGLCSKLIQAGLLIITIVITATATIIVVWQVGSSHY